MQGRQGPTFSKLKDEIIASDHVWLDPDTMPEQEELKIDD